MIIEIKRKMYIACVFFIVTFSIMTGFLILFDTNRPWHYQNLYLLPVAFALTVLLALSLRQINLVHVIVIGMYFLRNVITPLAMRFGDYRGYFTILNRDNVNKGLLLMSYETLAVFIFLATRRRSTERKFFGLPYIKMSKKWKRLLFSIFCSGVILSILFIPSIRATYHSIFLAGGEELLADDVAVVGSMARVIYTLANVAIPIFEVCIGAIWIEKSSKLPIARFKRLCIASMVCIVPFLLMNGSDGWTIILFMTYALTLVREFHIQIKDVIRIGIAGSILLIFVIIKKASGFTVLNTGSSMSKISLLLQAYLPGVCNNAGIFNVHGLDKFHTLFYDVYYTIPFRNSIFGIPGDGRLTMYYTEINRALSMILPTASQGYFYLGFLFSFVPSVLFVKGALKYVDKCLKTEKTFPYSVYILITIYFAVSPVMYNWVIFGARYFSTFLPLLLLLIFVKDKEEIQSICVQGTG